MVFVPWFCPPFQYYPYTAYYDAPASVTLTATGDLVTTNTGTTQWVFDYWKLNGSSDEITDNPLIVTVDGTETVMAVFSARKLTVLKDGEGTVRVVPPNTTHFPPFVKVYGNEDTQVQLTAIASSGWGFKEWTGDFPGTNPRTTPLLSLLVDRDRTITPVFAQVDLTVNKTGEGQVAVDPPDETLTPSFTKTYAIHTDVNLNAISDCGSIFEYWEGLPDSFSTPEWGLGTSTSNSVSLTLDEDETVRAVFRPLIIVLDPGHGGWGVPDPGVNNPLGAEGLNGYWEKDLTIDLALTVRTKLNEISSATVLMTRYDDEVVDFADRPKFARDNDADIFVSIHFNATIVPFHSEEMKGFSRELGTSQVNAAQDNAIRDAVTTSAFEKYIFGSSSIHTSNHIMLSDKYLGDDEVNPTSCTIAAMLLEVNYIRNSAFHQKWTSDGPNQGAFRASVALGIAEGILDCPSSE